MALNFRFHKLSYVWTILSCFIFFVFWFVFIFGWLFLVIELQLKWTLKFRWSKWTGSNMKLTGSRLTSSIILHIVIEWIAAWKFVEQIIRPNRPNYTQRSECKLRGMICRISDSMDDFEREVHIAIYIAIGANMNRCWLRWKIMLTHRYHTYTTFYLRSWLVVIRRAHPQFNSLLVRKRILQSTPHSSSS